MNSLRGKILAITRSRGDASEFLRLVSDEGGTGIPLPTIEIVPRFDAAGKLLEMLRSKRYEYCAFMSPQAVGIVFNITDVEEVKGALATTSIVAVGPETRAKLEGFGLDVDLVPSEYSSKGLVRMLAGMNPSGKRIIVPRSAAAGDYAASSLRSLGMEVDEVSLYAVRTAKVSEEWKKFVELLHKGKVSAIIFTSASSVASFFEILGGMDNVVELNNATQVVSIGPFTTEALKKRGVECHESTVHTVRGAVGLAASILTK
jgi:uroporphyrinogen-III synthase